MIKLLPLPVFLVVGSLLSGCMTAGDHKKNLASTEEREMTVGIVQREIRVGMSQADVATALGSPNIVTRDMGGTETWIYDKIATEASYSSSSRTIAGGVAGGGIAGPALILGGIGGVANRKAGAMSSTQKTLTVVIKFDENNLVKTFSYHSSKF